MKQHSRYLVRFFILIIRYIDNDINIYYNNIFSIFYFNG